MCLQATIRGNDRSVFSRPLFTTRSITDSSISLVLFRRTMLVLRSFSYHRCPHHRLSPLPPRRAGTARHEKGCTGGDPMRTKYKNDKQGESKAIFALYKERNIHPFASFLLVLVQFPILIGLYWVFSRGGLRSSLRPSLSVCPRAVRHQYGISRNTEYGGTRIVLAISRLRHNSSIHGSQWDRVA